MSSLFTKLNSILHLFNFYLHLVVRRYKKHNLLKETHEHYEAIVQKLSHQTNKKIKIASYVVFDSSFAGYGLMDIMLHNTDKYEPSIVIIPDISRGLEHQKNQYIITKNFFVNKYGSKYVKDGWNIDTNTYNDYSDNFNIIYLSNPYDDMVHTVHGIKYLSKKNVLPIYLSYGCMPDKYGSRVIIPMLEMSLFWKVFADNKITYNDFKKYEIYKGKNVLLSGYAKMDSLINFSEKKRSKKTIIISPHHTVMDPEFPLSNFLEYYLYIKELPIRYPNITFIFRPHPLLFTNLINRNIWTKEEVDSYLKDIQNNGMIYSTGGDYFDIFVNSDGIIHDCSSFLVEYLYTKKPCCFIANSNYHEIFSKLGKSCLKNYYVTFNENEITDFIENVIINENDPLKLRRENYAKNVLAINFPNVSNYILNKIEGFLC